jgi:hypothetical protein
MPLSHLYVSISHSCVQKLHLHVLKSHCARENRTLCIKMTLVHVKITLMHVEIILCVLKSHSGVFSEKLACQQKYFLKSTCEFHTQTCYFQTFAFDFCVPIRYIIYYCVFFQFYQHYHFKKFTR